MNQMKKVAIICLLACTAAVVGCSDPANQALQDQQAKKMDQAAKVMQDTQVPSFNHSVERENIVKRLKVTNDQNTLQWIYPISNGRVLGRFPVRGKVTSGSKRLTSTQQVNNYSNGSSYSNIVTEAPDEAGTYGSSTPYIFWFDPAGNYHQFQGDYFMSPVPYQIDKGYGTVSVEIDQAEADKKAEYDKQSNAQKGGK